MGRPSRLTDKQWEDAIALVNAGGTLRAIAAQFDIAVSPLAKRVKEHKEHQERKKELANQLVAAEFKIKDLPIKEQIEVHGIADDLRAISMHLAGAGRYGAATAHRLAGIANGKVAQIDDDAPIDDEGSLKALKGIAALTRMANEAAEIPMGLLKANKETVEDINRAAAPSAFPTVIKVTGIKPAAKDGV